MDIVEKLHKLSKMENTELDNEIEKAEQEYKEIFGNNDYTNVFDDDETYLKKLKECIKTRISYDDMYTGKISKDEFI